MTARIDLVGTFFATSLAIYLTYISKMSASDTGFSLNMASEYMSPVWLDHSPDGNHSSIAAFSTIIFQVIRMFNEFEIAGTITLRGSNVP